ncbi:CsbD family protein [Aerococcaceae bacterium NML191292]|nr:CsbD family protein [Aerococcaceae bacterium NML210727]MCW6654363.1 CsbD family protein [Aerococcaceae bacterium NML201296]MCW6659521.1 CsbD family protein [Aerococcaceae bacterium NML191292]MCW6661137.1 CsbD family protein [Aerococcaceae bacterium NML201209]MCW6662861.1 CsbD family protein [Aerococcaceae bacterium NML190073]MCW6664196.1 CsbD family protein [Aerococcaceae bacterium NML191219]MCW6666295.1 CsbD family protein [Aerococcaceae bacterium NML190938]MCW6674708.1 CsbD family prote
MSKEKVESKLDQVSGKVKEVAGQVTGDKHLEAEGKSEGLLGKVKEVAADVKDAVAGAVEGAKNALDKDNK